MDAFVKRPNLSQPVTPMTLQSHRLSQKYPGEMTELDRLLDAIRSRTPEPETRTMRPGSMPDRLLNRFDERLQRARREFDALMFFTVCFGMLKSGKSTLVNLLAGHEEASPTRFGQDTTLRPCLLLAGEKDEIAMFHMKDSVKGDDGTELERRAFNAVIDHLRGVIGVGELGGDHHVVSRVIPFTEDNIFRALCTREGFGSEPLITVVRIADASDLLRSEIALIDVPGLDSDQMKPEIRRYIELLERCDLLLFIQSTVSALNHGAAEVLRSLVKRSKGSPVWLVQNRFEAQTWRNTGEIEEQDSNLARIARKTLAKDLSIEERSIFTKQVNLGKAYDAHFRQTSIDSSRNRDNLLAESGFAEVVDDLSTKINEERLDIQLANCLGELSSAVARNRDDLRQLEEWIREEREHLFAFREAFDRIVERFSSKSGFVPIPENGDEPGDYAGAVRKIIKTYGDRWRTEIRSHLDGWKSEILEKMIGDEFNGQLELKKRDLFDRGPVKIFSLQSSFGSSVAEVFRRAVEKSSAFQSVLAEAQECMRAHGAPLIEAHVPDWKADEGPLYFEIRPDSLNRVNGGRKWFRKVKVEVDTCRNKIDDLAKILDAAVGRYIKRLEDAEVDEWFRRYRDDQLAELFKVQIRSRKQSKEQEAVESSNELARLSESLPALRESLEEIEDFTNRFRTKYNLA